MDILTPEERAKAEALLKSTELGTAVMTAMSEPSLDAHQACGVSFAILAGAEAVAADITKGIEPNADGSITVPAERMKAVRENTAKLILSVNTASEMANLMSLFGG
jgi:hypothetical protein